MLAELAVEYLLVNCRECAEIVKRAVEWLTLTFLKSLVLENLEVYEFPVAIDRPDVQHGLILVLSLMDVSPVADRTANVPGGCRDKSAVLAGLGFEFDDPDIIDLGAGTALVGQFEAAERFKIDLRQQVTFDAVFQDIIDLSFFTEIESTVNIV